MKFTRLLFSYSHLRPFLFFVQVKLHDGSVYTGVIEDIDVHSDLATIRINKVVLL